MDKNYWNDNKNNPLCKKYYWIWIISYLLIFVIGKPDFDNKNE